MTERLQHLGAAEQTGDGHMSAEKAVDDHERPRIADHLAGGTHHRLGQRAAEQCDGRPPAQTGGVRQASRLLEERGRNADAVLVLAGGVARRRRAARQKVELIGRVHERFAAP